MFRLGGQLPIKYGLVYTVAAARGLQYNEIQLLLGEATDYFPIEITEEAAKSFQKTTYGITITVHLPVTINPCEPNLQRRRFYKQSFKAQIAGLEALGAKRIVMHPGFKKDLLEGVAFDNLVNFISDVWSEDNNLELLLETDAGSKNGSAIGSPEFIRAVIYTLEQGNIGMCVDTTHLYARGINLWDGDVRKEFIDEFGSIIKLVHLNPPDLEVKFGGHLDRHNCTFLDREDLDHPPLIQALVQWPMILERRSLVIQERDNVYVRDVLGQPLIKIPSLRVN